MKKNFCLLALLFSLSLSLHSQEAVVFKGTVKCYIANDERATKGAQNVIVVPGFIPIKTGMTGPQGYYEINTGIPMKKLDGKYVTVFYISSCKSCESKKNVFVSEDQVTILGTKNLPYLTIETMQMKAACKNTELKPMQSDSIYNAFAKLPSQDLDKASALNVLTATPGFLNLLTTLASTVAVTGDAKGSADTVFILPSKIDGYGNFLFNSPMRLSGNTGFNFSPNRDLSEAVLWNPAALANSNNTVGVNFFTNLKNNYKFSAYGKVSDQFTIGIGGIYTKQDEFRLTRFSNIIFPLNKLVQHKRNLKEYGAYLTPSYKINNRFSIGVALKSIWQNFNVPDSLLIDQSQTPPKNTFIDRTINKQHFDADVSISYKISPSLQAGINVMNLAGTELFADALPAKKKIVPMQNLRSLGIGLCYKLKQFNFGTDVLLTEDELYDVSVGINYVPFNNALIAGGFAFKQKSFSLTLRLKYFKLSYINDNGLMVNDRREGRSSFFNGQLHSGFAFTF
jgi:hypothetical protein